MKKFICLFSIILLYASVANAQKQTDVLHAVIVDFFQAISNLDDAQLRLKSTPDFQLLENGEVWTIDTLITKLAPMKGRNVKRVNRFNFITTEQQGDMAWVSYDHEAHFTLGEKQQTVKWLESVVLVRERNQWKIRMMHSTRLRAE